MGRELNPYPKWLPALVFLKTYGGDWELYLKALYAFFKQDFIDHKPMFRGTKLGLKRHPLTQGKEATFWHLISEGTNEKDRVPDLRRCERIRWPCPIIEESDKRGLKIWENKRHNEIRICIWLEECEYLVILAKRKKYILPWTAYLVTRTHRKEKLRKEYEAYKKANAASKGGVVTPSTHGR